MDKCLVDGMHDGKDGSASIKLADCCCSRCPSKVDILHGIINGAIQVATALEDLIDHQTSSGGLAAFWFRAINTTVTRKYHWWLPIDGESDDE